MKRSGHRDYASGDVA